jgi:hypothetical protein
MLGRPVRRFHYLSLFLLTSPDAAHQFPIFRNQSQA